MRFILKQSAAFASMLSNTMEKSRQPTTKNTTPNNKGKKRAHADDNDEPCRVKTGFMQPKLVTGVKLKDYQLEVSGVLYSLRRRLIAIRLGCSVDGQLGPERHVRNFGR